MCYEMRVAVCLLMRVYYAFGGTVIHVDFLLTYYVYTSVHVVLENIDVSTVCAYFRVFES